MKNKHLVRLPSTPRNGFSRPLSTIALWGGTHARQGKNINSRSTEFLAFVTESNWRDKFDKLETGLKHRLAGLRECGGKEREHVFSKHRRRSRSRRFDEGAISYKNPPQRRAAFFLIHIWCPWSLQRKNRSAAISLAETSTKSSITRPAGPSLRPVDLA